MGKPSSDYFQKTLQINFKGVFHFENFYKMMYDWLGNRGWKHYLSNNDNIEDYYQETILPGGAAKNHWIWWRVKKVENDMFNYYMDVNIQTIVLGTKEVVYKGEKYKMNDGEINVFIKGYMEIDPKNDWVSSDEWQSPDKLRKNKTFLAHFANVYKDKDFINIIDDKEADLYDQMTTLFEKSKQFLNLMTAMPLQKPFHPELGYPQQ